MVIAASTGGPKAITKVTHSLNYQEKASFFVLLHGPAWALESFVKSLQRSTEMKVRLAEDGMYAAPGEIYVAPLLRSVSNS